MSVAQTYVHKIERHLRSLKSATEASLSEKIQEWAEIGRLDALAIVRDACNGQCAITHGACIYDIAHFAEVQLGESTHPQSLLKWGETYNVHTTRMLTEISRIDRNKLYVYKEKNEWMARKKTRLSAHNVASLERSIKAMGIKGAPLEDVFKEYETAYIDVFESTKLIVNDSNVWHTSVVPETM